MQTEPHVLDDVCYVIVRFLGCRDILTRFQPVCKAWYQCAQLCVTKINLKDDCTSKYFETTDTFFKSIVTRFPNLRKFNLGNNYNSRALYLLRGLKNLRLVTIYGNAIVSGKNQPYYSRTSFAEWCSEVISYFPNYCEHFKTRFK